MILEPIIEKRRKKKAFEPNFVFFSSLQEWDISGHTFFMELRPFCFIFSFLFFLIFIVQGKYIWSDKDAKTSVATIQKEQELYYL